MFLIDIAIFFILILIIVPIMMSVTEPFGSTAMVLSNIKDCSDITVKCSQDDKERYKLEQKLKKVKALPDVKSPLSKSTYKKYFKKNNIGVKPICNKNMGCGSKIKNGKYQKYVNDYADWKLKNKLFRRVEIPIEMSFYKKLKKLDNIISTNKKLSLKKEITTKKQLKKLIGSDNIIRAEAEISKKKAVVMFKMKPSEENNFYWTQTKDEKRYLYIEEILRKNNIPLTTNDKC